MTSSQKYTKVTLYFKPSSVFIPPSNHLKSIQQVSSSESVASDMDLETHSASEVVTQQLSSKDSVGLEWVGIGWLDRHF